MGKLYWFLYTNPGAFEFARGQHFSGKVKRVNQNIVMWAWSDGEGTETLEITIFQQQKTEVVTGQEHVLLDCNMRLMMMQNELC